MIKAIHGHPGLPEQRLVPIRTVSSLTGVNSVTLRVGRPLGDRTGQHRRGAFFQRFSAQQTRRPLSSSQPQPAGVSSYLAAIEVFIA
ncbi:MAG: hypothetical protein LM550_07615 [Candidatus Contendobacter sp.]|nr:hypothetical protein [Gammaproteobacteria bacterium]MCC8993541.1 hypothetical protein [Candidatus Contendobacter sp.]